MTRYQIEQQMFCKWLLWSCPNTDGYEYFRYDGCYYTKMIDDGSNHQRLKTIREKQNYKSKNDII